MRKGDHETRRQREILRRRFCPDHVRWLFIGESPPASGRFFYRGDSGLYRAMRDAFRTVEPSITDANFLDGFQASGCYLIDLCLEPVDHLDSQARRAVCLAGEVPLSRTIAQLQPQVIASVVRSIEDNLARAACQAQWHGQFIRLPYPGRWSHHRDVFMSLLAENLVLSGTLREDLRYSIAHALDSSRGD
jgi:hypothetical protein